MYDIHTILNTQDDPTTHNLILNEYLSLSPFIAPHVSHLTPLKNSCPLAYSKIQFALHNYEEAIKHFEHCDDKFYTSRMYFRMVQHGVKLQVGKSNDSLGYLFENKRFEEMMSFEVNTLFVNLVRSDPDFHKVFYEMTENETKSDDCNQEYRKSLLKIDYLANYALYKNDDRVEKLDSLLKKEEYPISHRLAYYIFDNYPIVGHQLAKHGNELGRILDGSFLKPLVLNFLAKNSKTDFNFLGAVGRHNTKFDIRLMSLVCNCMMNVATTNDSLYRSNENLLDSKQWNRFIGVSALGAIHRFSEEPYEILKDHLPSESDLKRGGSLLALGLMGAGEAHEEDIDFFTTFIVDTNLTGEVSYGALLGVGLSAMGTANFILLEQLLNKQTDSLELLSREGSILAIGLVNLSRYEKESPLIKECEENLIEILHVSEHEREARCACISLGLMLINTRKTVDFRRRDYNCCNCLVSCNCHEMKNDQKNEQPNSQSNQNNNYVNYANAIALGCAFCGTGKISVISDLLDMTRDGDINVNRISVFAIGLVCCKNLDLMIEVLGSLGTHFNPMIRGGVALTLGFFGCGTGDRRISDILEALLYDGDNLVVQQAALGLGFLFMQCNSFINENFKRILGRINSLIVDRSEDYGSKFGVLVGRALMESGGTNCVFTVLSNSGNVESVRVGGAVLFYHYWYWYPNFLFLTLCVTPTIFLRLNKDCELAECDSFLIKEKKSRFDFESVKMPEVKKTKRFKKKLVVKEKEVIVVEEPDEYVIGNGDRVSREELVAIGKRDWTVEFV